MTEKDFNFIEEIRNNPRIVNESDLQKMEYIELSYTGELIPVEEVEGKFDEFIKRLKDDVNKEQHVRVHCKFRVFEIIDNLAGDLK